MKRAYWSAGIFGFAVALAVMLVPSFFDSLIGVRFMLPSETGIAPALLRSYLVGVAFFVVFAMAAIPKTRKLHGGRPRR